MVLVNILIDGQNYKKHLLMDQNQVRISSK